MRPTRARAARFESRRILLICVDGLGPDYLSQSPTPTLDQVARERAFPVGRSIIPSVTNVNNVSILTGTLPAVHGISSNYFLDRQSGQEAYMESPEYLRIPTLLQPLIPPLALLELE